MSNSTACIAGGGYQHDHFFTSFTGKITQTPAHKSSAYIFKSQGGTMKEFQRIYLFIHRHQRNGKVDRLFYDAMQFIIRYGASHVGLYDTKRNFFVAVVIDIFKERLLMHR